MLTSGKQYLRPDIQLDKFNLRSGCTIHLSIKGSGGAGGSRGSGSETGMLYNLRRLFSKSIAI